MAAPERPVCWEGRPFLGHEVGPPSALGEKDFTLLRDTTDELYCECMVFMPR